MSTIATRLFNRPDSQAEDQEQLLKLFWNRAELKREFDKLRAQVAGFDEQLRQQEAGALRLQQRLDQLEAQLSHPDTACQAVAYYQLRGIWQSCWQRIASLAGDIERTCRDREQREHVAAFRNKVNHSLSGTRRKLKRISQLDESMAAEIRTLRERRARKTGIWNFFVRRRLTTTIRLKRQERRGVTLRVGELTASVRARLAEEPPAFTQLSVDARRLINLRVIAYAQELCLHFADEGLANMAREAAARDLADMRYGDRRDCRELSRKAERAQRALDADTGLLKRVQARATYLAATSEYRNATDTVPMAASIDGIAKLDDGARPTGQAANVNVLVDEYWEIFSVLLD